MQPPFAAASILEQERRLEAEELERLERLFWEAAGAHNRVALRTATDLPTPCFVAYARAADLLVVGRQGNGDDRDWNFGIDPGDAAMQAGRPILVVPPDVSALAAKRIVVAWRDTREARRAVSDALPFLKAAEAVSIGTVRSEAARSNVLDVEDYRRIQTVVATPGSWRLRWAFEIGGRIGLGEHHYRHRVGLLRRGAMNRADSGWRSRQG